MKIVMVATDKNRLPGSRRGDNELAHERELFKSALKAGIALAVAGLW